MADLRTVVTELVTGLGTLGHDSIKEALDARPEEMVSVAPEQWNLLQSAFDGGALASEFDQAFANGRAFLEADDGLRKRRPQLIEWKGAQANPGDEALPVDIRIDHVYLVSCKYLSKIVHNASPQRVFERSLRSSVGGGRAADWFGQVAGPEFHRLYELTVAACPEAQAPLTPSDLTKIDRAALKNAFPKKWSDDVESAYSSMCAKVANESAIKWNALLSTKAEQEATLWRILRFGPAPYFVLGAAKTDSLRLRIATPWDWRQQFALQRFAVSPKLGGQPMVSWHAVVKNRHSGSVVDVHGHVEIRWSHGRFGGPPEAKVYLDTPHQLIPGYFALS